MKMESLIYYQSLMATEVAALEKAKQSFQNTENQEDASCITQTWRSVQKAEKLNNDTTQLMDKYRTILEFTNQNLNRCHG